MIEVVLKVELHDDRIKTKAMKVVSKISGVESVSMDMNDQKLTLTGDIDPVVVVGKLRKLCNTDILSVGPAKEEKKDKEKEPAAEEKKEDPNENLVDLLKFCEAYNYNQMRQPHYICTSMEENPNACVIC